MARFTAPALVLSAFVAAGAGFAASHFADTRAMERLKADLDFARDCRQTGSAIAPCPARYRASRIEWRDRIETVEMPDRKQAGRIAALSIELSEARETIRDLERRRAWRSAPRASIAWWLQNGTIAHPYSTDERCPAGTVVAFEAADGLANRRSGDPGVCYVRSLSSTLALSQRR